MIEKFAYVQVVRKVVGQEPEWIDQGQLVDMLEKAMQWTRNESVSYQRPGEPYSLEWYELRSYTDLQPGPVDDTDEALTAWSDERERLYPLESESVLLRLSLVRPAPYVAVSFPGVDA